MHTLISDVANQYSCLLLVDLFTPLHIIYAHIIIVVYRRDTRMNHLDNRIRVFLLSALGSYNNKYILVTMCLRHLYKSLLRSYIQNCRDLKQIFRTYFFFFWRVNVFGKITISGSWYSVLIIGPLHDEIDLRIQNNL